MCLQKRPEPADNGPIIAARVEAEAAAAEVAAEAPTANPSIANASEDQAVVWPETEMKTSSGAATTRPL